MRIGVVADTHIPGRARALPAGLLEGLQRVDLILHAGDICIGAVLEELAAVAPVVAVAGNNDPPDLARTLGWQQVVSAGGRRIGLVHGHRGKGATTPQRALNAFSSAAVDCVVFGHSHIPYLELHEGVLAFNPGSPTDRRRRPTFSYGILHIGPDAIRGELRYLTRSPASKR